MSKRRIIPELKYDADDVYDFGNWHNALAWYEGGNRKPLLDMLLSDAEITPTVRYYLADLLERQPKRRVPSKQTPAHSMSQAMFDLLDATQEVGRLVDGGKRVRHAVIEVAASRKIKAGTLQNAYAGKHFRLRKVLEQFPFMKRARGR